jgi:probable F420-dependent oxidoreductase
MSSRPIRFGLASFSNRWYLPSHDDWIEKVKQIEKLGFSSIYIPDHFGTFAPQWEPIATMAAIAALTKKLTVGTSVMNIDYRHPAVLAQASATIHMISDGRHELGIGAGWLQDEYRQLGIPFYSPRIRFERFNEAVQIIKSIWTDQSTTFEGKHFQISGLPKSVLLADGETPKLLIGGGGPRMMRFGGKHADIVNMWRSSSETYRDHNLENLGKKIDHVRKGALSVGRDLDDVELSLWIPRVIITDEPEKEIQVLADTYNLAVEDVSNSITLLIGTEDQIRETLMKYVGVGVTYFLVAFRSFEDIELFADMIIQ